MNMKNTFHIVEAIERELSDNSLSSMKFAISHAERVIYILSEDTSTTAWTHAVHSYTWSEDQEEVNIRDLVDEAAFTCMADAVAHWSRLANFITHQTAEA